jgi:ribonuclease P protein component
LNKFDRLRKNTEFATVCRFGRRWSSPFFNMYVKKNHLGNIRLGVSVSKRVGNSVVRNKNKRRLKEAFRHQLDHLTPGFDAVITAKPQINNIDYFIISKELVKLLKRSRLWHD